MPNDEIIIVTVAKKGAAASQAYKVELPLIPDEKVSQTLKRAVAKLKAELK